MHHSETSIKLIDICFMCAAITNCFRLISHGMLWTVCICALGCGILGAATTSELEVNLYIYISMATKGVSSDTMLDENVEKSKRVLTMSNVVNSPVTSDL